MKRPFGVVFSAIVLLLLSLLQLLMAFGMAVSGAILPMHPAAHGLPGAPPPPPMPNWMPIFMYVLCAFFAALAAWGIATTVGLFRLRRWARYSVLVIGGSLALIGFVSAITTGLLMLVSIPLPSTVNASQAQTVQTMTKAVFGVIAFIYMVICAVGISWLIYFNRRKVRELFAATNTVQLLAGGTPVPDLAAPALDLSGSRPFLISVLAVLNMIGACGCLLMALVPIPGALFGLILHGWQKVALYLFFALVQAAIGVGLWRLREWGRLLALGMIVFGVAQSLVYVVRPSLMLKYGAAMSRAMVPAQPQLQGRFLTLSYSISFGFSILLCCAIAALLIYYRAAFQSGKDHLLSEPPVLS
jgi:cell division protein FtsL